MWHGSSGFPSVVSDSPLMEPKDWRSLAAALVAKNGDANVTDTYGESLLIKAVRARRCDLVELLLHLNAKVDLPCMFVHGGGCLLLACDLQHRPLVELLVGRRADVNRPNADNHTALMVALEHGDAPLSNYLLDQAADPEACDKQGQSVLLKAAEHGVVDVYGRILRGCPVACVPKEARGDVPVMHEAPRETSPNRAMAPAPPMAPTSPTRMAPPNVAMAQQPPIAAGMYGMPAGMPDGMYGMPMGAPGNPLSPTHNAMSRGPSHSPSRRL